LHPLNITSLVCGFIKIGTWGVVRDCDNGRGWGLQYLGYRIGHKCGGLGFFIVCNLYSICSRFLIETPLLGIDGCAFKSAPLSKPWRELFFLPTTTPIAHFNGVALAVTVQIDAN